MNFKEQLATMAMSLAIARHGLRSFVTNPPQPYWFLYSSKLFSRPRLSIRSVFQNSSPSYPSNITPDITTRSGLGADGVSAGEVIDLKEKRLSERQPHHFYQHHQGPLSPLPRRCGPSSERGHGLCCWDRSKYRFRHSVIVMPVCL